MLGIGLWQNVAVISGGGASPAAATFSSAATDKYNTIALSGGNLTATGFSGGNIDFVRATREAQAGISTAKFTITSFFKLVIAVDDGTVDYGATTYAAYNTLEGAVDSKGVTFYYLTGATDGIIQGNSNADFQNPSISLTSGDSVLVQTDTTANTVKFFKNTLSTQIGTTVTWTPASGKYFAAVGGDNGSPTFVADLSSY